MSAEIVTLTRKRRGRSARRGDARSRTLLGSLALVSSIRLIERAQDDLGSTRREQAVRYVLGLAITDLKRAVASEIEAAATSLSHDLAHALGPEFTVAEVNGARAVLDLVLKALPCYIPTGGA